MVDFRQLDALGFDSESARERFLNSKEFYFSCMKMYLRSNDIERLTELCREQNWPKAMECVHMMKGSTGNLALDGLFEHYCTMTELFRAGESAKAVEMLPAAQLMEQKLRTAAGSLDV